ncbi:MAG TPA: DUF5808 domain-containing protein [Ktedonobacterales bacterium]
MSAYVIFLLVLFALLLAVAVGLFLPIGRSRTQPGSAADREFTGPISRDDDRYWIAGIIYYNPDDPDALVPKRYGYGRTINFGHPRGKVALLVLIGLILLPIVLAIFFPGLLSYGCQPTGCHLLP